MFSDREIRRQWVALSPLALCMLLASLGTSIANIALPAIAVDLGAPFHRVQHVAVAYLASLTLFSLLAGRLGDRIGGARALLVGLAVFCFASALCALAPDIWSLIAARAAQGAGAACLAVLTLMLARERIEPARLGRGMGVLAAMSAIGTALGPSLGAALLTASGWRAAFMALAVLGAAVLGATLLATGDRVARVQPDRPRGWFAPGWMLRRMLANALVAAVMMATLIVGPFYLGLAQGLSDPQIGAAMTFGPIISICVGPLAGRRVDLWSAVRVERLGLTALALGCAALVVLPVSFGLGGYLAAIAVLTPGYQFFQTANNTAVMQAAPQARRGEASGQLALSRHLGLVLGAWALGAVFAFGAGGGALSAAAPEAVTAGMRLSFALCAALMLGVLTLLRR